MVPPDDGLADHRAPLLRDSLNVKEFGYSQILQHLYGDLRRQVSKDVESRLRILLQQTNLAGDVSRQTSCSKLSKGGLLDICLGIPSRMRPMLSRVRIQQYSRITHSQSHAVRELEGPHGSSNLGFVEHASSIAPQSACNVHRLLVLLALRAGEWHAVHVWDTPTV
jgi:hypothetical protein